MAKTLNCSVTDNLYFSLANALADVTVTDTLTDNFAQALTPGTGANGTADLVYHALTSLAGAASTTLDLTALTDSFGATVNMARVKFIRIRMLGTADDATSLGGFLLVGNAAATAWTGIISSTTATIQVGGVAGRKAVFQMACDDATGWVVTGGAKSLKILNNHATLSVKFQIIIVGSSA